MARDATLTRSRLLRAGERRFARDGVTGARLADIVRDAHQANDSAVNYHFGSREGLLRAIVERHLATMELHREVPPQDADLRTVVALIVEPTAALLGTEDGRDFLRIMEQVSDWSGLGRGQVNSVLDGTLLAAQLAALNALLVERFGAVLARERAALLVTFLTGALAERARSRSAGHRQRLGHGRYVAHLVDVLSAGLAA